MVDERHECLEASEAGRAKQDGEAGRAKQDAEAAQSSAPTLNTWTRKGLKAAKAAEAADADGGKQPKTKQQGGTGFQQSAAAAAAAVLPGVSDSWVTHVDKQLSESELESLRSCTTRPKLFDAPEHPEYKVGIKNGDANNLLFLKTIDKSDLTNQITWGSLTTLILYLPRPSNHVIPVGS